MKKQNKNKSYKQLYKTKGRLDMSKGGRVKLSHGGRPIREDYRNMADFREAMDSWLSNPDHTATSDDTTTTTTTTAAESQAKLDEFEDARRQRVIDTGAGAADIAQGNFGAGVNPKADVANILNEDGDVSSNTIADTSEIKEGGTRAKVNKVADTPAEKVEKIVPNSKITYVDNASKDERSYRVNFDKIKNELGYKTIWSLEKGIENIYGELKRRNFSENEFNDKNFYRLKYIKWLIKNNKLDSNLFII